MCSSWRGPARAPSLVTWPTNTTDTPRCLAIATRSPAHARTCVTLPGVPVASGSCTVWIESITTTDGCSASIAVATDGIAVSARIQRCGGSSPGSRSARRRTCWADSSADTSRHFSPPDAMADIACSSSVDLPMPGSPPTSVTDPGTSPPLSTRSSSPRPVERAVAVEWSTSPSSCGSVRGPAGRRSRVDATASTSSTNVFHSPHVGHFPAHRNAVAPQSVHRWIVFAFAIPGGYEAPRTVPGMLVGSVVAAPEHEHGQAQEQEDGADGGEEHVGVPCGGGDGDGGTGAETRCPRLARPRHADGQLEAQRLAQGGLIVRLEAEPGPELAGEAVVAERLDPLAQVDGP